MYVNPTVVIRVMSFECIKFMTASFSHCSDPHYAVCFLLTDRLQNDSEENIQTIPTIGFNVEVLQYKNIKFQVWDLGGQTSIRPYWRCYYPNTGNDDTTTTILYHHDEQQLPRLLFSLIKSKVIFL